MNVVRFASDIARSPTCFVEHQFQMSSLWGIGLSEDTSIVRIGEKSENATIFGMTIQDLIDDMHLGTFL